MATAFQSGFKLGGDMFNQAERNRLLAAQEERAAAESKQRLEEGGLRIAAARRVDDATQALTNAQTLGLQVPENVAANRTDNMSALRRAEAGMDDSYMGQAAPASAPLGLRPEYRPATDLDLNRLRGIVADAKGDVAGAEALRLGRKGIEFEEGYKRYTDEWSKMDDAAKSALIDKLSLDSGVKGFGSWVPGKGKQAGYMNYLPPGGDPIRLSAKEAGDLFVLSNLMQIDPMRVRTEMDKVSDKVRAVAAQAFDAQTKGVTANNQATRFANADANDSARLAATREYYGALRDRANRPQAGDLREFVNDKGEVTLVDITGLPRGTDGTIPLPAGLKPRTAKPEFTPKDYAETVKLYTEAGYPIEDARMMADKDYGRGPSTSADDRLRAKDDGVSKARRPIEVRPGEVIARDPSIPVRAPLDSFLRESVRQPIWRGGGLQYMYRDPLTNRIYTIDEYNKLLSE